MEILIVGGGYIGMYTARRLERLLRRGEATGDRGGPARVHDLSAVPGGDGRGLG